MEAELAAGHRRGDEGADLWRGEGADAWGNFVVHQPQRIEEGECWDSSGFTDCWSMEGSNAITGFSIPRRQDLIWSILRWRLLNEKSITLVGNRAAGMWIGCRQEKTESGIVQREVIMKVRFVDTRSWSPPIFLWCLGKRRRESCSQGWSSSWRTEESQKSGVGCHVQCVFLQRRMMTHFHLIDCASYAGLKKKDG